MTSLETWFAHPRLLTLLGLLPLVTWLLLRAYRKKQAALATFGNGFFPNRLLSRGNDRRFLRGLVLYFALLFLIVGILGGYTTFSSFALENFEQIRSGEFGVALLNSIGSVVVGTVAVWLGDLLATAKH